MIRMPLAAALFFVAFALPARAQTPPVQPAQRTPQIDRQLDQIVGGSTDQTSQREISTQAGGRLGPASRSVEGRVVEVNAADKVLVVEGRKGGLRYNVPLSDKTKLKADGGAAAGREGLSVADFKPGQVVKVTFQLDPGGAEPPSPNVLEVRLRRQKN